MAKDLGNVFRRVAGWIAPNPTRDYLARKWRECTTYEGRETVEEAMRLQRRFPDLSAPELIRLAYWGASGPVED